MKAGSTLILSDNEIRDLYAILKGVNLEYSGDNPLVSVYENRVVLPIEGIKDNISYYLEVNEFFQSAQNLTVEKNIVARAMSEKEREALFLKKIERFPDRKIVEKLLKESKENLLEKLRVVEGKRDLRKVSHRPSHHSHVETRHLFSDQSSTRKWHRRGRLFHDDGETGHRSLR